MKVIALAAEQRLLSPESHGSKGSSATQIQYIFLIFYIHTHTHITRWCMQTYVQKYSHKHTHSLVTKTKESNTLQFLFE